MTREEGAQRAEWIGKDGGKGSCWVYWRRPEEWAEALSSWVVQFILLEIRSGRANREFKVEETGQKNTVLTLYELTEGETSVSQGKLLQLGNRRPHNAHKAVEIHGMDPDILQKSLNVLVKRGKAQVFGSEDQQGVKFF